MDALYNQRAWFKKRRDAVLTCPECGHTGARVLDTSYNKPILGAMMAKSTLYTLHCKCERCGEEYKVEL